MPSVRVWCREHATYVITDSDEDLPCPGMDTNAGEDDCRKSWIIIVE